MEGRGGREGGIRFKCEASVLQVARLSSTSPCTPPLLHLSMHTVNIIQTLHPSRAALSAGVRHVLLVSSMGTTQPDTFLDKLGDGHALFYKLNGKEGPPH